MSPYPELDRLAAKQQQVVTLGQCRRQGLNADHIQYAIKTGLMVRVRGAVYRWCGAKPNWKMMAMSAVLASGDPAVLSHRSAAALWGLIEEHDVDSIEITHPKARRLAGVTAHRHSLERSERDVRFGIPVTNIERTLLDVAESLDKIQIGRLIDDALRRRLTTTKRLAAALAKRSGPGRRRTSTMRAALADRGEGYNPGANDWEQRMDRMWEEMGLPEAERQYKVRLKHRTYVLDRAIVALKIGAEWNGRGTHGTRSDFDYDSQRRADLVQDGWIMLDFTTNTSPEQVVRTVLAACEQRRKLLLLSA